MCVIGVASGGLAGAFYCNNPKKTPPPYTATFNPINPLSNPTLPESAFRLIPELENTINANVSTHIHKGTIIRNYI